MSRRRRQIMWQHIAGLIVICLVLVPLEFMFGLWPLLAQITLQAWCIVWMCRRLRVIP